MILYNSIGVMCENKSDSPPLGLDCKNLENDACKRVSDNMPVSLNLPRDNQKTGLCATTSKFVPISKNMSSPTMIIRWKDKEAFDRRKTCFMEKATVARIQANGRNYAVCRISDMTSYMLCSFAKFMDLSLPVFKNGDEVKAVMEKLPPSVDGVSWGTSRYYDKWEQPDGSVFPASNQILEPQGRFSSIGTWTPRIDYTVIVKDKKLMEFGKAKYLLVQL